MPRAAVFLLLSLATAGPAHGQDVLLGADPGFHPVVENGRVAWLAGDGDGHALELRLWNGQNTIVLDTSAAGGWPGWPDLDSSGRVAYVGLVDGRYELMLWDGFETRQLTHSDVPGSDVDLGSPITEEKGGFPSIAYGDVIFADVNGDLHVYDGADATIRPITTDPAHRTLLTTAEYRSVMQAAGVKAPFHFDGRWVTWLHQTVSGDSSELTLFQADAREGYRPHAITTFTAWTPHSAAGPGHNAILAGLVADPLVTACGRQVAWMYNPPGDAPLENVVIGYYDGFLAREVAQGRFIPLQLDVSDGHVAWMEQEDPDEGPDRVLIRGYRDGAIGTVATIESPPTAAGAGDTFWGGPTGLIVYGSEVLWFMDEVACEPMELGAMGTVCTYPPTQQAGIFTASGGPDSPIRQYPVGDVVPGGSFSAGLYAWRSHDLSIRAGRLLAGGAGEDTGLLQITDLQRPDAIPVGPADDRTFIADAFGLRAFDGGGECSGGLGREATVAAITLNVAAEAGLQAELTDITALRLYRDVNRNRRIDEGDMLAGETASPTADTRFDLAEPVVIAPGEDTRWLVEVTLADAAAVCPCNRYTVSLASEGVAAGAVPVQGGSSGALVLDPPVIGPLWGDAQVGLPSALLPDALGFRVADLPAECGATGRFRLVYGAEGDTAELAHASGATGTDLPVALDAAEGGLQSEVRLTLGERDGPYSVEGSLVYPEDAVCAPRAVTFGAMAGPFVLQVVDANDPAFVDATPETGHADYDTWAVTLTEDVERLAEGGAHRAGTAADGLSALLLRAWLPGATEAPPGTVELSLSAAEGAGFLTAGIGERIPAQGGSQSVTAEWTMTANGPVAIAVYTPPRQLDDPSLSERELTFTATYEMPGVAEPFVAEATALLYRPPILLTHGMWSSSAAWGAAYVNADGRYETYLADYASRAAENFDALGGVMRQEIQEVRDDWHGRGIAVTQVSVVAHSMGGLITRQYINQGRGADFRRADNFGAGDIFALVTMGTPHYGSPIAWLTLTLRDPASGVADAFNAVTSAVGMDIWSGAVDAMCPGSEALRALGPTHVPSHTIRAWHLDTHTETLGWGAFVGYVTGLFDALLDGLVHGGIPPSPLALVKYSLEFGVGLALEGGVQALYGAQMTDYLVTLESQSGGITQGSAFVFPGIMHSAVPGVADGETTSAAIAAHVFDVLTYVPEDTSVFAPGLPAPLVDTDYISCE